MQLIKGKRQVAFGQNMQLGLIFVGTRELIWIPPLPPIPFTFLRLLCRIEKSTAQLTYIGEKVKGNAKVQLKYK